ncbi:uncharacterized protein LOC110431243 [Sorghum bicolor]|nr:uncharacterized protein LOC110431243 [Sorghum bicolor]|eukprot:XP_021305782.1 uncharacterized protein LOC110431243 [Sorghum bicolor]
MVTQQSSEQSLPGKSAMAFSSSKTTRLLVLLQIALFVMSALIMPRSVCHGARSVGLGSIGYDPFDPNRPVCLAGRCPVPGKPYGRGGGGDPYENRPGHGGGGPGSYYPDKPAIPSYGETSNP